MEIGEGCRLSRCTMRFFGDGNRVFIERDCVANELDIWVSDGGTVNIGHNTHFSGKTHLACIEGKTIEIGERCLFSTDIVFRTGDSHSILDMNGVRINPAADIHIGDHVWLGQQVTVLKGANVSSECVVGTGALITGKQFEANVIIAGSPAKTIRENITWYHDLK
ncbi:MAG: acyltransferase [Clostridiales bacterium]|nr:acyltransferase [Clostridiales bacterium]